VKRRSVHPARPVSAFTLVELLAVIAIIALLLGTILPAFSSVLGENTLTLAKNRLQFAIAGASDSASRASFGNDTVAAFLYNPDRETFTIQTFVQAGTVLDGRIPTEPDPAPGDFVERDVFVADPTTEPFELPRGYAVRGYVPAGWMVDALGGSASGAGVWYAGSGETYAGNVDRAHWVFPENFNFNPGVDDSANGAGRHTFVFRFEGGTGRFSNDPSEVLLVVPGLLRSLRSIPLYREFNVLEDVSAFNWASRTLGASVFEPVLGGSEGNRLRLIGDRSVDTVLARPVPRVALYEPAELHERIENVRADRETGILYRRTGARTAPTRDWEPVPNVNTPAAYEGIAQFFSSETLDEDAEPNAFVYVPDAGAGRLREVSR